MGDFIAWPNRFGVLSGVKEATDEIGRSAFIATRCETYSY